MCRSEGGLGQPPKTLRAAVVRLCPAGGAELEAAPPRLRGRGSLASFRGTLGRGRKAISRTEHPLTGQQGNVGNRGMQSAGQEHGPQHAQG